MRTLLPSLLLAFALAVPTVAHAEPPRPEAPSAAAVAEARRHFARGVDLYKEGDYRGTLIELRRAEALAPNYRVLFNIGQTLMVLQQYAEARDAYRSYLEKGGAAVPPQRRGVVEEELKRLEARIGRVEVRVNVAGAEITIDDEVIGTAPLAAARELSAGRRKITVSAPGHIPITRYVDVLGDDRAVVDFTLEASFSPSTAPVPSPVVAGSLGSTSPARSPSTREARVSPSATPWIALGATGLLTAGAVVSGVLALRAKGDLDDRIGAPSANAADIDATRSRARTYSIGADILGVSAVVGAGITGYLFITRRSSATGAVGVGVSPTGASLSGTF
jgi:hypothetical protein